VERKPTAFVPKIEGRSRPKGASEKKRKRDRWATGSEVVEANFVYREASFPQHVEYHLGKELHGETSESYERETLDRKMGMGAHGGKGPRWSPQTVHWGPLKKNQRCQF